MDPTSSTTQVKPKPAKPNPPVSNPQGAVASAPAAPTALNADGSYDFLYTINPQETRRLLTRTGRANREEMEKELPRYVERIVKRAVESEIY